MKPKVSIIIPVYNGSNFLDQSIYSALSQTYPNIEVIVVNDGSTDMGKTEEIALSFGERIRYFSKNNGGVASALNFGIKQMTGDFFSWLSHDDLYSADKIKKQVSHLSSLPKDSISFCDFEYINEKGVKGSTVRVENYLADHFKPQLLENNFLHGCALLIPRTIFDAVGFFNENLMTTNDYDLWFRMADDFRFEYLPEVLVQSRQHSQQTNRTLSDLHRRECNTLYIHQMNRLFDDIDIFHLPNVYFAKLAVKFYKNDFMEAATHAYYLYKKLLIQNEKLFLPPFYITRLMLKLYTIKKSLFRVTISDALKTFPKN